MKKCPYCAEEIQDEAIKCRYCESTLDMPILNDEKLRPLGECPHCGLVNSPIAKTMKCKRCGKSIIQSEPLKKQEDLKKQEGLKTKITFPQFLKEFFVNYKIFIGKYLTKENPPFLMVVIWLLGMMLIIDRLETGVGEEYQIDNWIVVWLFVVIAGFIIGYISSWIGGVFFHWRVWLSGGKRDMDISRNLFVYANLPVSLAYISFYVFVTIAYGNAYFSVSTNDLLDIILGVFIIGAITYSIVLGYKGARLLHETKVFRSVIFFIIVPAIIVAWTIGQVFYQTLQQYNVGQNYATLALEQMYIDNYDEAERLLNQALKKMTKDDVEERITIYGNLGLLYENKGEIDKAIENYKHALSLEKTNSSGYYSWWGKIKVLEGNVYEAVIKFEMALEFDPDNFDAHNQLGIIFMGFLDEEIQNYTKALAHNEKAYILNNIPSTAENLAINYYMLNRYSDALPLFEKLNEFYSNNAMAKYFLGLIYYENNDLPKAKIFLRDAIIIDPSLYNETIGQILEIDKGIEQYDSFEEGV